MSTAPSDCRQPIDDLILVSRCVVDDQPPPGLHHLTVDDFYDPDEVEITGDEIHVTVFRRDDGGDLYGEVPFCFRLSVASARALVERLDQAIQAREPHGRGGEAAR